MAFLPLIPAALCLLYGKRRADEKQAGVACTEMVIAFGMLLQTHMISLEIMVLATAVFCLFHLRRNIQPVRAVCMAEISRHSIAAEFVVLAAVPGNNGQRHIRWYVWRHNDERRAYDPTARLYDSRTFHLEHL